MTRIHYDFHKIDLNGKPKSAFGTILVVDSNHPDYLVRLKEELEDCQLVHQKEIWMASEILWSNQVNAVLIDHSQESPCLGLLKLFKSTFPGIPVVIIATQSSENLIVEVFRLGARDYFKHPFPIDELAQTLRALLWVNSTFPTQPASLMPRGLGNALKYIQSNFKSHLSLAEVAHQAGMSTSSFSHCFKNKIGITFVDYVNSLRIYNANRLLRETQLSLLDVALSCGFNNQSHFNRVFKKHIGVTPGEYRRRMNGGGGKDTS